MSRQNLFTINVESEKVIDFDEFVLRQESEALQQKRKELNDRFRSALYKRIGKSALIALIPFLAVILAVGCLIIAADVYFNSGTIPYVLSVLALVLLFIAGVSFVISRKHQNTSELDSNIEFVDDEYGVYNDLVKQELSVPTAAATVDLFVNIYSQNNTKPREIYATDTADVFEENGKLCFRYESVVIGFPISEIEGVVRLNERIAFDSWTKDSSYDSQDYMSYEIQKHTVDKYDEHYSMMGYYSLRLTHADRPYEILIPLYDIAPIMKILKTEPINQ